MKGVWIKTLLQRLLRSLARKVLLQLHPPTTIQDLEIDCGCNIITVSSCQQLPHRTPENIDIEHLSNQICLGDPQYKHSFRTTYGQIIPETILADIGTAYITQVIKTKSGQWFGVASRRGKFLRIQGTEYNQQHASKLWSASSKTIETGAWIGDFWFTNYYHWFICCMPKVIAAIKAGYGSNIILTGNYPNTPFIIDSLRLLGLETSKLPVIESSKTKVNKLVVTESARASPLLLKEIRNRLLTNHAISQLTSNNQNRIIYISRANAKHRNLINEQEVIDLCRRLNITCIQSERYSLHEQIAIYSSAQILIGAHGAGLTNMIWMPEGSTIIEIQSNELMFPHFYQLALATNKRYWHVEAHLLDKKSNFQGNCLVNVSSLEQVIEEALARNDLRQ